MRLDEIVAALPESWVKQGNCRAQKRPMSIKAKRASLDPYQIGMMRVKEMGIAFCNLEDEQIVEIGRCSINRIAIVVGKERNKWVVAHLSGAKCREYRGHGYIIKGKKTIPLQHHKQGTLEELMNAYECSADCSLDRLDAEGLFNAFQGRRIHKCKQKGGWALSEQFKWTSCKTEEHSRPWKRGERVHMRSENRKKTEANMKEQAALGIIRVARIGLVYKSQTKAVHSKNMN